MFTYEMAAVTPALLLDGGSMRKTQKSALADAIIKDYPGAITDKRDQTVEIFDGCALLHQLPWPKVGTIHDVCSSVVNHVSVSSIEAQHICVIFDYYDLATTKEPEQKRRRIGKSPSADIVVESTTPVPSDKESFLSNSNNK